MARRDNPYGMGWAFPRRLTKCNVQSTRRRRIGRAQATATLAGSCSLFADLEILCRAMRGTLKAECRGVLEFEPVRRSCARAIGRAETLRYHPF